VAGSLDHLEYPLVVVEELDVSFYASVDRLEKHLEAIDVSEGIYVAYDAAGRRLALGVTPPKRSRKILGLTFDTTPSPQFVVVESWEADPRHADELETVLREIPRRSRTRGTGPRKLARGAHGTGQLTRRSDEVGIQRVRVRKFLV